MAAQSENSEMRRRCSNGVSYHLLCRRSAVNRARSTPLCTTYYNIGFWRLIKITLKALYLIKFLEGYFYKMT